MDRLIGDKRIGNKVKREIQLQLGLEIQSEQEWGNDIRTLWRGKF